MFNWFRKKKIVNIPVTSGAPYLKGGNRTIHDEVRAKCEAAIFLAEDGALRSAGKMLRYAAALYDKKLDAEYSAQFRDQLQTVYGQYRTQVDNKYADHYTWSKWLNEQYSAIESICSMPIGSAEAYIANYVAPNWGESNAPKV